MRGLATLVTLALVCGFCKPEVHTTKHFEIVQSWTAIDYLFPDEEARNKSIQDGSFVLGNPVPFGMDVHPESGRVFLGIPKFNLGIPASLVTVSETKDHKGENYVEPYPDWSWHTRGCDGITSVEKIAIDECDRLWVMDTGTVYKDGFLLPMGQVCPAQILIFDLKTNQLIRKHKLREADYSYQSYLATTVIDVINTDSDCRDTFAYVADSGEFAMIVYDFAADESWLVRSNEMFPYPEYGRFNISGVDYDLMYGIYSMTLSPKTSSNDRTLFFNTISSGKESYVKTSVLKRKEDFHLYNHVFSEFKTYPNPRPYGPTGSDVMDEHGIMFFNSFNHLRLFCWNHKNDYTQEHMAEIDRDDVAFQLFADMKIAKKDGIADLYMLTNTFQKFLLGVPNITDEVLFRVMKAPVQSLIQGTVCVGDEPHRK